MMALRCKMSSQSQKIHHKITARGCKQLSGAADLLDFTMVHDHDLIRDGLGFFLIMGDHDTGDADLALNVFERSAQLFTDFGIKCAKWLIEQQKLGIGGQGARQCDTLTLTT